MEVLNKLKGGLIVSCQALPDEPLHSSMIMSKMAQAAIEGGAVGIRANGFEDILAIKQQLNVPIIGICKEVYDDSDVYITPTMNEVEKLVAVGVDIIALDSTNRIRPNMMRLVDFVNEIKSKYPNQLLMADCATIDDVKLAIDCEFDIISSTLVGYTQESSNTSIEENNFQLLKKMQKLTQENGIYFIAEGNIDTPEKVHEVLKYGVDSVVVGSMITRPQIITKKFVSAINSEINFVDLDGVLIDENETISKKTIQKLRQNVAMPVINSGRLMHDVKYIVDKYNLESNFNIAANGAHIQTKAGHDIIIHKFSEEIRDEIYKNLRGKDFVNVRVEVNTKENRYFFSKRPKNFPKEFIDSSIVSNIDDIITKLDVIGFLLIFDNYESIENVIEPLAKKYKGVVNFERSSSTSLEIYSSKASKGNAIKYLKEKGFIAPTTLTRAFGDSFNDISMFEQVDISYAIASNPEVEMKADHVVNNLYEGLK